MRSPRPQLAPVAAPAVGPAESIVQELSNLYFELFRRRSDLLRAVISEFELSATLARTLMMMDPEKSMTMREAAQIAFLEPSNLTGVIDKLEARGLVKRSLDATDRRIKLISVTRAGAKLRTQIFARVREPAPWMLALSARDQRQLLVILRKGLAFEQTRTGAPKG